MQFFSFGRFRDGDHEAAGRLVEIFYPELRRIAGARWAERPDHTLQRTAVVHPLISNWSKSKRFDRPVRTELMEGRISWLGSVFDEAVADSLRPSTLETFRHSRAGVEPLAAITPALRRVVELKAFGKT